jgi:hypothetical protein
MADTDSMVSDFITYRKYIEEKRVLPQYFESSKDDLVYEHMFTKNTVDDNSTLATVESTSFDTTFDKSIINTSSDEYDNDDNDNNNKDKKKNATNEIDDDHYDISNSSFVDVDEALEYYQPQGTTLMM